MAKKHQPVVAALKRGDAVRIKNFGDRIGRIAELRGPLGPGGASVYRVLLQRKPTVSYIELLGDQLEYVPMTGQVVLAQKRKTTQNSQKAKKS
jgi:hypothetical protein